MDGKSDGRTDGRMKNRTPVSHLAKAGATKTELVSQLNIDNSEVFDTQTWAQQHRCDQVPSGSKHHPPCLCIRRISR